MAKLPDGILRAWEHDTPGRLGGWLAVAGADPAEMFAPRAVSDHEWIGWTVDIPGVGAGRIIRSIVHPQGRLMFDLEFPGPVSSIRLAGGRAETPFRDRPDWQEAVHRYSGRELLEIIAITGAESYPPADN